MKIVVLGGAGAMGRGVVRDLFTSAPEATIVVADRNIEAARAEAASYRSERVIAVEADASSVERLVPALRGADVCVNSTIHDLNLRVMQSCIEARCHYNDLGGLFFVAREQYKMRDAFSRAGLSAVLGIGSSPGTTNMLARYAADRLDTISKANARCAFTGASMINGVFVPPYAMQTLIEEYAVPPPELLDGEWRTVPPCSGEEMIDFFEPLGKVKCHYTLHSEPFQFATSFAEKGIREATFKLGPPRELDETARLIVALGFAEKDEVDVDGSRISPRRFMAAMVQRQIAAKLKDTKIEIETFNVLRAEVEGTKDGARTTYLVDAIAHPHPEWPDIVDSATSIPPSICAQMQARGLVKPGAAFPETALPVDRYFRELTKRPGTTLRVTQRAALI